MKQYTHIPTGKVFIKILVATSNCYWDEAHEIEIPAFIVENGKDWEEVKQSEYTILAFKADYGAIFNYMPDKNTYASRPNVPGSTINHFLNEKYDIWSVQRNSDNEILTIDDKAVFNKKHYFTIKKFYFDCNNNHLLCSNKAGTGHISICKISKAKKLFTTEDGVDIFEGDEYYCISKTNPSLVKYKSVNGSTKNSNFVDFFSKEKAEEWIFFNKPCLSINDLLLEDTNIPVKVTYEYLKSLVKSKL